MVMPAGVLWPRANGGPAEYVKADPPGLQQQSTHWQQMPEPVTPAPATSMPEANADLPGFLAARALGAQVTRPRK